MVHPVMNAFKEIETCLECSAKKLVYVGEVFYYALKAVIHPTAPLFEPQSQTLKPLCVSALKRIFVMCDRDMVSHGLTPLLAALMLASLTNLRWHAILTAGLRMA